MVYSGKRPSGLSKLWGMKDVDGGEGVIDRLPPSPMGKAKLTENDAKAIISSLVRCMITRRPASW
jgi:hypothetical protein